MAIWMLVTKDEYELPIMIADTATELAEMAGTTENSIRSLVSKVRAGKYPRSRYVKVEED